jgi:predicted glutamine amidotransferase
MAYIGHPMLVADVVLWPDRSIIKQSYDARERLQDPSLPFHLGFGNLNGDGFGIGWFNTEERREQDPSPCMFKSITPAWCAVARVAARGPAHSQQQGRLPWAAAVARAAAMASRPLP